MDVKKIIGIWGVLDLAALGWYLIPQVFQGKMPFYDDMLTSIQGSMNYGLPYLSIITAISLLLILSLAFSGFYLIRHNKIGLTLGFIQTPFRIVFLMPPSIFFIIWPLKYLVDGPKTLLTIALAVILVLLSETLKLYSLFQWRKQLREVP